MTVNGEADQGPGEPDPASQLSHHPPSSMSLQDLPPEITLAILSFLREDKWPLYQVTLTSRALRANAEIVLYSDVYIKPDGLMRFTATVRENPRLAALVKSYSGPSASFHTSLVDHGWVQSLVNVTRLHLIITDWQLPKFPSGLEKLALEGFYEPSEVDRLLSGLESLNYLWFRDFTPGNRHPFSPHACPNLKVLNGSLNPAAAILPGRNVKRFEWIYLRDEPVQLPDGPLYQLSPYLTNIRSLSYMRRDTSDRIHPLYALPEVLPSLQFLEIQIMHPDDWSSIPKLTQLRVLLVLEPSYLFTSMLDTPDRIIDLFDKCPRLERVDVGGRGYSSTSTCKRWLRGSREPVPVPLHIAERGRTEFLDDVDEK